MMMPVITGVRPSCLKYRVRKGSRQALAQEHRKLKVPARARARLMSICLFLFMVVLLGSSVSSNRATWSKKLDSN